MRPEVSRDAALRWVCRGGQPRFFYARFEGRLTARFEGRMFKEAYSAVFTRRSPLLGFEYGNNLLYRLLGDTVHLFPVTLSLSFVGNAVNTEKYVY